MDPKASSARVATVVSLVLALAVSVLAPGVGSASDTPARDVCVPVHDVAVGPACKLPNGMLQLTFPNGMTAVTHGADPLPPEARTPRSGLTPWNAYTWPGQVPPKCFKDRNREFYGHVIYARSPDAPNRYSRKLTEIRAMVNVINGILRESAALAGRRSDFRMLCTGGKVTVSRANLPTRDSNASFFSIVTDLIQQGYADARAKYWIWYDGPTRGGAAGVGTFRGDSRKSAENANNYGASWAVTFGLGLTQGGIRTMMHEAGHNLGVVQLDAPNSSQAGHCIDGQDIMCYPEPGNTYAIQNFNNNVCSRERWDCRQNDYYNPRPKRGTYIYSHWNTGSPLNRFMSGCQFATGTLTAPGGNLVNDPKLVGNRAVSKTCWSRPFALSGVMFGPYAVARQHARHTTDIAEIAWIVGESPGGEVLRAYRPDFSVCFYKGTRQLRCYEREGTETGTIPYGATKMKIWLAEGADATYFFNAV